MYLDSRSRLRWPFLEALQNFEFLLILFRHQIGTGLAIVVVNGEAQIHILLPQDFDQVHILQKRNKNYLTAKMGMPIFVEAINPGILLKQPQAWAP